MLTNTKRQMLFRTLFLFASIIIGYQSAAQVIVGDVKLPQEIKANNIDLVLNGAGIREILWWDLYVGGLYLQKKNSDDKIIVNADETMAVKMYVTSSMITIERMEEAIREGFDKSTKGNLTPVAKRIDDIITTFSTEIKIGDVFDLIYLPKEGVNIYKNDQLANTIYGLDFKIALFGIWLSNDPVDKNLKKAMLGQ
jgi:hypothetical protein